MAPTVPLICFSLYAALSYLAPQNSVSPARGQLSRQSAYYGGDRPASPRRAVGLRELDLQSASFQPLRLSLHSLLVPNSLISHPRICLIRLLFHIKYDFAPLRTTDYSFDNWCSVHCTTCDGPIWGPSVPPGPCLTLGDSRMKEQEGK